MLFLHIGCSLSCAGRRNHSWMSKLAGTYPAEIWIRACAFVSGRSIISVKLATQARAKEASEFVKNFLREFPDSSLCQLE